MKYSIKLKDFQIPDPEFKIGSLEIESEISLAEVSQLAKIYKEFGLDQLIAEIVKSL